MKRLPLSWVVVLYALTHAVLCTAASAATVKGIPGTQYALVIGIERFQEPTVRPLTYCAEDARAFYDVLVHRDYGCYLEKNVSLLLNKEATTANITARLKDLARRATKDDTVTIFFSSHGFQDKEGRSYWVTHDTRMDLKKSVSEGHPVLSKETRLDNGMIASRFDDIDAHRFIVFLDCCFSADTVLRTTRGISGIVPPRTGRLKDPFAELKGKGRVVISSSDGNERSAEVPGLKHGAFTYYLLKGLRGEADPNRDNVVEVLELWDYLEQKVQEAASRVGVFQKPTMTLTKFTHHFPLTTYPLLAAAEESTPPPKPEPRPEPAPKQEEEPEPPPEPLREPHYADITVGDGKALSVSTQEVTNAEFAEFVSENPQWSKRNIDARYHDGDYLKHWSGSTYPEGQGDYPVVYVSWFAAKAYAEWRGGRLLTEAEWETVASGAGGGQFPWGDEWDATRCNSAESGTSSLQPADSFEEGAAVWQEDKLFNVAGNAWEWCDDFYYKYEDATPSERSVGRVVKGGSFRSDRLGCLVSAQLIADPRLCSDDGGFRVCKD